MPASKRKAEVTKSPTRASKAAKIAEEKDKSKPAMTAAEFKDKAKPLHVKLSLPDGESVGELGLVPTSFSTGSYGWKGNKKITIQLPGSEGGETTNVQVMLTFNATVVGSKGSKSTEGKDDAEETVESEGKKQEEL